MVKVGGLQLRLGVRDTPNRRAYPKDIYPRLRVVGFFPFGVAEVVLEDATT
jgi:hypothetical protein